MPLFKTIPKYQIPSRREALGHGTSVDGRARNLQERLDRLINRYGLLGLQVSSQNREGEIWAGASGTADLDRQVELTTDHVMRIASTTKLFTSVVTLGNLSDSRIFEVVEGMAEAALATDI